MMRVAGTSAALMEQLTDEEAQELAELAKGGDGSAREKLIHSLVGLALSIAGSYARNSRWEMDESELQGEALEALVRYGVDNFDPGSGIPIRVWAALTIRRRLARAMERDQRVRNIAGAGIHYGTVTLVHDEPWVRQEECNPADELRRHLKWALREGVITELQHAVLTLRGAGEMFDAIGARLRIHRKKAGREYTAALAALEGRS